MESPTRESKHWALLCTQVVLISQKGDFRLHALQQSMHDHLENFARFVAKFSYNWISGNLTSNIHVYKGRRDY